MEVTYGVRPDFMTFGIICNHYNRSSSGDVDIANGSNTISKAIFSDESIMFTRFVRGKDGEADLSRGTTNGKADVFALQKIERNVREIRKRGIH